MANEFANRPACGYALPRTAVYRQSSITRYFGPTDRKGSRVAAISASGHRLTLHWDDALSTDENHTAAALQLAQKLGWSGNWHGGALGTGDGYCFVNADEMPAFRVARASEPKAA